MAIRPARLEPLGLSAYGRERMVNGRAAASGEKRIDLSEELTFPTKVPSDSLGWIGSLKRTSDKSLFPMALGSCGHRITHQLRPINMNGRSILAVTSRIACFGDILNMDGPLVEIGSRSVFDNRCAGARFPDGP